VLGSLLVLAFLSNRLARRTGVPDVLVLMATGLLIGPVMHWVQAVQFAPYTRVFGTLALILILFEAGLELELRDAVRHFGGSVLLAMVSYVFSTLGVALLCRYSLNVRPMTALLIGAILGCMSSTIVLAVLGQLPLRPNVAVTLTVESSFGDALGALTTGVLLGLAGGAMGAEGATPVMALLRDLGLFGGKKVVLGGLAGAFLLQIVVAAAFGALMGILWTRLLPLLAEQRFWHVLTFAAILLLYAGTHAVGGSDLFAVMTFGFVLANFPKRGPVLAAALEGEAKGPRQTLAFHSELGFLIRTFFFVMIGVVTDIHAMRQFAVESLGLLGMLFLCRVLAVQASRTAWRGTKAEERELASLLIPRGLINAVLALEVAQARPELGYVSSLVFATILLTNLLMLLSTMRSRDALASIVKAEAAAQAGSGAPAAEIADVKG
jgi:Na+:H+ antiporter